MDFQYRSLHSVLGCDTKVEIFPGNSSIWCLNPYSNDEVKDIENLWSRHQAEFLLFLPHPSLSLLSLALSHSIPLLASLHSPPLTLTSPLTLALSYFSLSSPISPPPSFLPFSPSLSLPLFSPSPPPSPPLSHAYTSLKIVSNQPWQEFCLVLQPETYRLSLRCPIANSNVNK